LNGSDIEAMIQTLPTIEGTDGNDVLYGTANAEILSGGVGNDYLDAGAGNDVLNGGSGNDVLVGGTGSDTMLGGTGNDTYYVDDPTDVVTESANEGTDTVRSSVSYTLTDNLENLTLTGTDAINATGNDLNNTLYGNSANNTLTGNAGDDYLDAGAGNDILIGGTGNDVLVGGTGSDTMLGGIGNDTYYVDDPADILTENVSEGTDTVRSSVSYTLSNNLENLTLTGIDAINATGNDLNNTLYGNSANNTLTGNAGDDYLDAGAGNDILSGGSGNDVLVGGTGSDTMLGGTGNDTYYVDDPSDVVTENINEGTDTVRSSVTYALTDNVENLTLTGTDAINATGNDLANTLYGNVAANTLTGNAGDDYLDAGSGNDVLYGGAGNDVLVGGTGSDTMAGGLGNDTYYVDDAGDVVTENANEGTDTVRSSVTYILSDNTENLTLTGTDAINATGNDLANTIYGNTAANTLTGNAGDDYLDAGAGNDILIGGTGNDVLVGGTGSDTMAGGTGNDTYYVDDPADVVTENANEGTDTVRSSVSYTLTDNLENLTLTGADAINATGNDLNNSIYGNAAANTLTGNAGDDYLDAGAGNDILMGGTGNDVLVGGTGIDTMAGGLGNDTYYVDDPADLIAENVNEGTDTVRSSVSYTLSDNLENLTLTGTDAINATGNDLANTLYGNSANNTLTGNAGNDYLDAGAGNDQLIGGTGNDVLVGGTGSDTMTGGLGNDTYYVDDAGDVVTENLSEGTDTVRSSVTYTLTDNIENLTLTGTDAINATGNDLANSIYGNAAANTLTANAGDDYLDAGAGNDVLNGGTGNDVLVGGTGSDTMSGGLGNDTYYVDDLNDLVAESLGEGTDTVRSSVTYSLTDNIENMTLTGTDAINATGNDLANTIYGNTASNTLTGNAGDDYLDAGAGNDVLNGGTGNDVLVGGTGSDTMSGGLGNDTYYVDDPTDSITENASEGTDTVRSSVNYTLTDNVENLTLTGTDAINATGNDLNNTLYGNTANNTLTGGLGNDYLNGGAGNDTYVFSLGNGNDTVSDSGADTSTSDQILFGSDVLQNTIALFQSGQNLVIGYGSADRVTITNQASADYGVERIGLNNGLFLTNTDVNLVIQQITAFASSHGITLTNVDNVRANQDLMNIIANAWHG
jgi:Ca2+-binding RTX toxin-like protein